MERLLVLNQWVLEVCHRQAMGVLMFVEEPPILAKSILCPELRKPSPIPLPSNKASDE
jgi:hypothetical protein